MKIIILGAGGRLGAALLREYRDKFDVAGFNHTQLDLSDLGAVREKLLKASFDVLINAAGFTKVDLCEAQPDRAFVINSEAPRVVAEICDEKNATLIHFSTDYVFDGDKREPYTEEDEANPISVYGESKLAGESNVLAVQYQNLVVRVSWVFGPDRPSFIDAMVQQAQKNGTLGNAVGGNTRNGQWIAAMMLACLSKQRRLARGNYETWPAGSPVALFIRCFPRRNTRA